MKDIRKALAALLIASLAIGLGSCKKEADNTVEEDPLNTVSEETNLQETDSEETEAEETATQASDVGSEDEAYQEFIDGLTAAVRGNVGGYYYGPGRSDGDIGIAAYYLAYSDSFCYMFTDIDGDERHELLIGHEDYAQNGEVFIRVDGFVCLDQNNECYILIAGWERSQNEYLGNGYFLNRGSAGAGIHYFTIMHYNGTDIVTDAWLEEEYYGGDTPYPGPDYTLHLGGDTSVICGDEAKGRWVEILGEAQSYDNELLGSEWIQVVI